MSFISLDSLEEGAETTTKLAWCEFQSTWITCNEQGDLLSYTGSNGFECKSICDGKLTALAVSPSNDTFAIAFDETVYVRNFLDCTENVKMFGRRTLPITQILYSFDSDQM
jgi:hypothetical protein